MREDTTQPAARVYSQRLGALTLQQFQAALTRFGLGTFVGATAVAQGLFGQNVFVQSTQGEYVLRGVPHYTWQFPKERFGARLLHERTQVPGASPYLLDTATDIFGWPYLLLPRLHGSSPADHHWTDAERLDIAQALGQNLFHLHQLTWPFAGAYDHTSDTIQPFGEGFAAWIVADIRQWLAAARANGRTTTDDIAWTEHVIGTVLTQYGLVRVVQLLSSPEAYDGWRVNRRPPQLGDSGTLVAILRAPGLPDTYVVAASGLDGTTIWLSDVANGRYYACHCHKDRF